MKLLFLVLLFVHGLIHLLGFLKSFGFSEISQLTNEISRPMGIVWLFTTMVFFVVIVALFFNKEWWWMPAIIAVLTSQILIVNSWNDAKFGTVANVVILFVIIIGFAAWKFNEQTSKEISELLSKKQGSERTVVTQEMIEPLPESVQNWLKKIGMVGKERINTVYLKQNGQMRLEPDQKEWAKATAEQYVTTENPAFLWKVKMNMMSVLPVAGRDLYMDGKGQMIIKLASLIPVVNVSNNEKTNQSILQRYLLELSLYPSAALHSYISWEEIDQHTAKATMTYKGVTGSAIYYFNESADLEKVSAFRYKDNDEKAEPIECVGEIIDTTEIEGIEIPTELNISWMLEEGKFTWYKLDIVEMKFNEM